MAKKTIPAISIIIPMYNAEKYVGECLDSILAQTFDDYEVIIVDDCSTDNSYKVVESYLPLFNNRGGCDKLRIIRSKVNSGGAGTPRNIGIGHSYGDYIFFMDSDDAMMPDALDILYNSAQKFQADVVHCEKFYQAPGDTVTTDINLLKDINRNSDIFATPTLMSDNLAERVKIFLSSKFKWEPWNHLIRRDSIINNNLKFHNLSVADDLLFSFLMMCVAEKIVVIPNTFYVWRNRQDSNSKIVSAVEKQMHRRGGDVVKIVVILAEILKEFELFRENLEYRYAVFDFLAGSSGISDILSFYSTDNAAHLYELIRREVVNIKGDTTELTAFLFTRMNFLHANLNRYAQIIRQQNIQIQQMQMQLQQQNGITFKIT